MVELLRAGFENSPPMPEVEFHTALWDSKLAIQAPLQKDPSIWPRLMRRLTVVYASPLLLPLAAWTSPCRNNNINGLTLAPLESITLLFMLHLIKTEGVKFPPF